MKFLFDFFPVLLFFLTFKTTDDIFTATAVAIVATTVQVAAYWHKNKRVENMHLVTLGLLVVFGGATLVLQDELYIKWKVSVLNWLFGLAFLLSQFIGERPIVQRLMGKTITLPRPIWRRLNLAWAVFFLTVGFVNLYVVYNFDTDTWVNFKLFGVLGLTLVFVVGQSLFIARHIQEDGDAKEGR